jgi:hypothetical protein
MILIVFLLINLNPFNANYYKYEISTFHSFLSAINFFVRIYTCIGPGKTDLGNFA